MVWRGAAAARTVGLTVCGLGVLYEIYSFFNILSQPNISSLTWLVLVGTTAVFAVSLYQLTKWRPSS